MLIIKINRDTQTPKTGSINRAMLLDFPAAIFRLRISESHENKAIIVAAP
jgi:hypothetical protein